MSGVGIIVQARMSSSRLPGKSLKNIGGKPLIQYVIDRLLMTGLPVFVCTSSDPTDDVLADYLMREKIPFYRGSLDNVLHRYIQTAEMFGIAKIVRVTGDNPFVDIVALKRSLNLFDNFTYMDAIYLNGFIKGTGFELVTLNELKSLETDKRDHLEHVTTALRERIPDRRDYISLEPPEYHLDKQGMVLTCDYQEDLDIITLLLKHFHYNPGVTIREILELYHQDPDIFRRNAELHQ